MHRTLGFYQYLLLNTEEILINYGLFDGKNGINESIETFHIKVSKIIIGYLCVYKDELIEIANSLNVPYTIMEPSYQRDTYQLIEKSE